MQPPLLNEIGNILSYLLASILFHKSVKPTAFSQHFYSFFFSKDYSWLVPEICGAGNCSSLTTEDNMLIRCDVTKASRITGCLQFFSGRGEGCVKIAHRYLEALSGNPTIPLAQPTQQVKMIYRSQSFPLTNVPNTGAYGDICGSFFTRLYIQYRTTVANPCFKCLKNKQLLQKRGNFQTCNPNLCVA